MILVMAARPPKKPEPRDDRLDATVLVRMAPTERETYAALAKETYVSPMAFAYLYALSGEREKAFEWLERAFAERSPWLVGLKYDPAFDRIRSDRGKRIRDIQNS